MNREIKFRAWCEGKHDNMTFSEPHMEYFVTVHEGAYASVESGWDIHGTYPTVPLMQFTGLKDRHGKEIYEGDIVKIKNKKWDFEKEKEIWVTQIVWVKCENLGYCKAYFDLEAQNKWDNGHSYEDWRDDWEENDNIETIGNIYENSELLKS